MKSPEPPIPMSLKDRWLEYMASTKLDLRGLLIEAVSEHEGWEESAIALVDEAIMPVLESEYPTPDRALIEKLEELAPRQRSTEMYRLGFSQCKASAISVAREHRTPDRDGLIKKLEAAKFSSRWVPLRADSQDISSSQKLFNKGLDRAISIIKGDASTRKDEAQTHASEPSDSGVSALPKLGCACNTGSPSEIPVVDERALALVQDRLADEHGKYRDMSIRMVIEYYESHRSPEPVSGIVKILLEQKHSRCDCGIADEVFEALEAACKNHAKAVLDTAGVNYVD